MVCRGQPSSGPAGVSVPQLLHPGPQVLSLAHLDEEPTTWLEKHLALGDSPWEPLGEGRPLGMPGTAS